MGKKAESGPNRPGMKRTPLGSYFAIDAGGFRKREAMRVPTTPGWAQGHLGEMNRLKIPKKKAAKKKAAKKK